MVECEVCGKKDAKGVCPRCYRFVCEDCVDPNTLECVDCTSVKRVIEDDLLRYLDSLEGKLGFMERNFERCSACPLYKDTLLSCVRRVKELKSLAKLEAYERLHDRVDDLKDRVQQLAVKYLISLKMAELRKS